MIDNLNKWNEAIAYLDNEDRESALFIFRSLYKKGMLQSARMIAIIYETASEFDELQDYEKALRWYEISAYEAKDIMGYIGLSKIYFYGLGVDIDLDNSLRLLEKIEGSGYHLVHFFKGKVLMSKSTEGFTLDSAKKEFETAYKKGNLVSLLYLSEIAKKERKNFLAFKYRFIGFFKLLFALYKNTNDEFSNDI